MKVNDELSCDVLFRNLALLLGGSSPQGPRRHDNRRRGDGHMEENCVKDAFFPQMLHPEWKLGPPAALAVSLLPLFIGLYLQEKHYSENRAHLGV